MIEITDIITPEQAAEARRIGNIRRSRRVVITCHMSPDGDAMGSSLALARVLDNMGISARVFTPDEPNRNLMILPGAERVLCFSRYGGVILRSFGSADLVVSLDYNAFSRLSRMAQPAAESPAAKIMIDHHLNPETEGFEAVVSASDRSSTCSLLYSVLVAAGLDKYIDSDVATCLLAGMMTDTNNFSHNANHSEDYLIVSDLVARGADKNRLYTELFNTFSESCLRLNGYAISQKMTLFGPQHGAMIILSRDELNSFSYAKGDTEGLVNRPLAIPGIVYSAYFREESDYIKVSMRSVGDFPCDIICSKYFGGGGHRNASGGEFHGTLDEAAALFSSLVDEFNRLYIDSDKASNFNSQQS